MIKIRFFISFCLITILVISNLFGQGFNAKIQLSEQMDDSLTIKVTLKNETCHYYFLVCDLNNINFVDYVPISVNYGSFKAEVEARKKNQISERDGTIKDTIKIVIPITTDRYQFDFNGNKLDVYDILTELQEHNHNRNISMEIPKPPDGILTEEDFIDSGLFEMIAREKIDLHEEDCLFCSETIIFSPYEEKSFHIDLRYLLMRKATYQLQFNYKSDNKLFKKETEFLRKLGYIRFKGLIISNIFYIVSE